MIDLSAQNIQNSSEDERQRLRGMCKKSLYFLAKAVLCFKDLDPEFHKPACDLLQDQTVKRKRILLPRSTFKSHMGTIAYPIWLTIQDVDEPAGFYGPHERILIANATADNSQHFLAKIKSVYERNPVFQWLFPELIPDFTSPRIRWNQTECSIARPVEYPDPTFTAVGVGSALASRHFTHIILDDLVNEKHAESPDLMSKAIDWYKIVEPLLVVIENEILVIGTRWAFSDIYSHIDKTDGEYDPVRNPKGYKTYIRSAIEDGKPTLPARLPLQAMIDFKRKRGAYLFSCLYLNNPSQPDVNSFQETWLRPYVLDHKNHLIISPPHGDGLPLDPTPMQRFVVIDIAASQAKRADYTAVVVVACDEKRRIYILEAWRGRVSSTKFINQAIRFAFKWHVDAIYFENYGQQKLIEDPLRQALQERGRFIEVKPIRGAATKNVIDTQINLFSKYCEAGTVYYRESMTDFLEEYREYPLSEHKDILAALSYAPKIFTFSYEDIPDQRLEVVEDDRRRRNIVHARPGVITETWPEDEDSNIEMMLARSGRSNVTGY